MSETQGYTPEQRAKLEQAEKLLRHAGKCRTAEEAATYTARAMAIIEGYNLDISDVDETGEKGGQRAEEKMEGGWYEYERDIWEWVGELNFCLVWHRKIWVERPAAEREHARVQAYQDPYRRRHVLRGQFQIVGRRANIAATRMMAQYLLQTIERLTRERLEERIGGTVGIAAQLRTKWAVDFRRGCASTMVGKLMERYRTQLAEDKVREQQEAARLAEAASAGASTATTLTVASVRKSEREANVDFRYGAGTSALIQKQRREEAARAAAEQAEMTRLAAENPEEYRRREAEREKAARKASGRGGGGRVRRDNTDWSAFSAGRKAAEKVGVDPQAGGVRSAGALS